MADRLDRSPPSDLSVEIPNTPPPAYSLIDGVPDELDDEDLPRNQVLPEDGDGAEDVADDHRSIASWDSLLDSSEEGSSDPANVLDREDGEGDEAEERPWKGARNDMYYVDTDPHRPGRLSPFSDDDDGDIAVRDNDGDDDPNKPKVEDRTRSQSPDAPGSANKYERFIKRFEADMLARARGNEAGPSGSRQRSVSHSPPRDPATALSSRNRAEEAQGNARPHRPKRVRLAPLEIIDLCDPSSPLDPELDQFEVLDKKPEMP